MNNETPVEFRWEVVGKIIRAFEGEIRVLDVENARWSLTTLQAESELACTRLAKCTRQLAVRQDGLAAAHGDKWLSKSAEAHIKKQISI